ncbi:flavin reductase family protein [Duganella sp. FT134W]|uniref:Flavin reductase family protein n=1 Tax=Duganella margarita TaxID=2692170 RepID=A0A7X4GY59_9BURK|nr:flavin reductase family protein [Duganella margarita]MYM71818.1 flavin reductase family protein [Duganella margarita]
MKKKYRKQPYDVANIRRLLEPGPVVLVSSAWQDKTNIMTMGWHMMIGFQPALFGCYIDESNHSYDMVVNSRECVINLPTAELLEQVIGIGNCSGAEQDKFSLFGLTATPAEEVAAPLIAECYASFECRLADAHPNPNHPLFVWEVVRAHVANTPRLPKTLHYRGDGEYMVSGREIATLDRYPNQRR